MELNQVFDFLRPTQPSAFPNSVDVNQKTLPLASIPFSNQNVTAFKVSMINAPRVKLVEEGSYFP